MIKDLLNQVKKTVVFIGKPTEDRKDTAVLGTGVLVEIGSKCYLATAKHVIFNLDEKGEVVSKRDNLCGIINTVHQRYTMAAIPFSALEANGAKWMYDKNNSQVDLALIAFDYEIAKQPEKGIGVDVNSVKGTYFIDPSLLYETLDVFYVSYHPGLTSPSQDHKVAPIIRDGIIARIQEDKMLYIDGFAFPGNSGSPVFDKASGNFVGIISAYLPYRDEAVSKQTGKTRVIFEENTGLSQVWSGNCLKVIVSQHEVQAIEGPNNNIKEVK
jgi:V8-like Glu-specific endopeptidase